MKVDFLVVGLGLAGANLICELQRRGFSFLAYDDDRTPSSQLAAGLMNPITGRNYARSWRIDALLDRATTNYSWFNQFLDDDYFYALDIRRVLNNPSEENKWASRLSERGYEGFLAPEDPHNLSRFGFHPNDRVIHVKGGFRVETGKLVDDLKQKLIQENRCRNERFAFDDVNYADKTYRDIEYGSLVCCEGAFGAGSPFEDLPVIHNLGEVLHVQLKSGTPEFAYKKKVFIVPMSDHYWVGGTYTNIKKGESIQPNYDRLIKGFEEAYVGDYDLIRKTWGIRPTVKDRRPIIGAHPKLSAVYVLNGLGTKGSTLGPYAALHLVDHIVNDQEIDPEISIERFAMR